MGSTFDFRPDAEVKEEPVQDLWPRYRTAEFAKALVAPHKLLFVSMSGSHLHGTSTPESDRDFKGVFLPNEQSSFLNEQPKHFSYTSGEKDSRNSADDVDFQLWSVQEWTSLLAKGDSNALSVLFSAWNTDMVMYYDPAMNELLEKFHHLYNPNNIDGFTGFAKGQAVKYGLKGTRLKVLENVKNYVDLAEGSMGGFTDETRLEDLNLEELVDLCQEEDTEDKHYLSVVLKEDKIFLKVLTKEHQSTIFMTEFRERLEREYEKYGVRAHTAKDMDGKDWKSLSHSLRSLYEAYELLGSGRVNYPLASAAVLHVVKQGLISLLEFELAYNELEKLLKDFTDKHVRENFYDRVKVNQMILNLYKKEEPNDSSGQD